MIIDKRAAAGMLVAVAGLVHAETDISFHSSTNCPIFDQSTCAGSTQGIQVKGDSWRIRFSEGREDAHFRPFNKTYSLGSVATVGGVVAWSKHINAKTIAGDVTFRPTENTAINLGGYAGQLSASVHLDASAGINSRWLQRLPHDTYSRIARDGYDLSLLSYHYATDAQSPYGGLSQSAGALFPVLPRTQFFITQQAQAGLDIVAVGAGIGALYTTGNDADMPRNIGDFCHSGQVSSKATFTLAAGVCAQKTLRDPLYDRMLRKAGTIADRLNGWTDTAQNTADKVEDKTGYGYTLRRHTDKSVARWLGVESPYDMRTNFIIAASGRVGDVTLGASYSIPLGNRGKATTAFSLGYQF